MAKKSWGPSNPLWRWQHGKGKVKKASKMARRHRKKGGFKKGHRKGQASLRIMDYALQTGAGLLTGFLKVSDKAPTAIKSYSGGYENEVVGGAVGLGTGLIIKKNPVVSTLAGAFGAWAGRAASGMVNKGTSTTVKANLYG